MTAKEIIEEKIAELKGGILYAFNRRHISVVGSKTFYNISIRLIKDRIKTVRDLQRCLNYLNNITFKNK